MVAPDRSAAVCGFVSRGAKCAAGKGECGWLHVNIGGVQAGDTRPGARGNGTTKTARVVDWNGLDKIYRGWVKAEALSAHARSLGVSVDSLDVLSIGFADGDRWAFPMRDASDRIIGIRFRDARTAEKRAYKGSRNGLFIPRSFWTIWIDSVVVCEGPTDCAALLSVRLNAIGRPSALTGAAMLVSLCKGHAVTIVADGDEVGRNGAEQLAAKLDNARIVHPPAGIKDARAWVGAGACAKDICP